jgi:hypothetical protein
MRATAESIHEGHRKSWPIWLFVTVCLFLNVSLPTFLEWCDEWWGLSMDEEILCMIGFGGIVGGECCFVVLVGGLYRQTWLDSFFLGLAILSLGYLAVLAGMWLMGDYEALAGICFLPAFLFAATSPLYALRQLAGWRLSRRGVEPTFKQPFVIADMFCVIAIAAVTIVLLRVPLVIWEEEDSWDYWSPILITGVVLFGIGLLVMPLSVRFAFGARTRMASLSGLFVVAVIAHIVAVGISQCFYQWDASWKSRSEALLPVLILTGSATLVYYLSVLSLSLSGISLIRHRHGGRLRSKSNTLDEDERLLAASQRRTARWRIAGAIAATTIISASLAYLQSWRSAKDAEIQLRRALAEELGGGLRSRDRRVRSITLGTAATDADIRKFDVFSEIEYLDVSSSQVTNQGLTDLTLFPHLKALTLNETGITDAGLIRLAKLPELYELNLINTPIVGDGVRHLPRSIIKLNLDYSQFSDDGCRNLQHLTNLSELSLQGTLVTDEGVARLMDLPALSYLNLQETSVRGHGFRGFPALQSLRLDNSAINDAGVGRLRELPALQRLYLSHTEITDASVEHLKRMDMTTIDLSDTSLTNSAISQLKDAPRLVYLHLSGTAVSGMAFRDWRPRGRRMGLDLNRTPFTDDDLRYLVALSPFNYLSLADTNLTDACLPHIAKIQVDHTLDLSNTHVTAKGLLTSGWATGDLKLSAGQFTTAEVDQLEKQLGIDVHVPDLRGK